MAIRSLLLGWGNSTARQLAIYGRLHGKLGLRPEVVVPATVRGLFSARLQAESTRSLVERLTHADEDGPLLVHVFSDNGVIAYAALLEALSGSARGRRVRDAIAGVIFDSAPGLYAVRSAGEFAERFAGAMTPQVARALGREPRAHLPLAKPVLKALFIAHYHLFPRIVRTMVSAAERAAVQQPPCPQLYLYGDLDLLVPAVDVERYAEAQRRKGLSVELVRFPGAHHVALYPADPPKYRDALGRFVARVAGARVAEAR